MDSNLRRHYNRVMATKEAQAGRCSVVEPVYIHVVVDTDSVAAMHAVAEFLESHEDAGKIYLDPEPSFYGPAGLVAGHVRMELIPAIAAIEGVLRVAEDPATVPLSSQGQLASNPAVLTDVDGRCWTAPAARDWVGNYWLTRSRWWTCPLKLRRKLPKVDRA